MISGTLSRPLEAWPAFEHADGSIDVFPEPWRSDRRLLELVACGETVSWTYWPIARAWLIVLGFDVLIWPEPKPDVQLVS